MSNVFVTADLHFSHSNIIQYSNRPFNSSQEMDNVLIKNWNNVVSKDDTIYVLGDFTMRGAENRSWFEKTLRTLKGRKILILGNHDKVDALKYVEFGFESVHTSLIVDGIFLAHDPALANCLPLGMNMFCGHVHELFTLLTGKRNVLNVGVDVWDYAPVSWQMAKRFVE